MPKFFGNGTPPCATAVKFKALWESRMAADGALIDRVTGIAMLFPAPVMVTVPLYVPAESDPGVAVTVSEPGDEGVAVPLVGEMLSHEPPEVDAEKASDPPPVFRTCTVWLTALLPWFALKLTLCVSTPSTAGVDDWTVKVTPTVVVAGDALGTVIVMVPESEPATRADGSAAIWRVAGMVPAEGVTVSQLALVEAVKANPGIGDERLITCPPGALPPAVAEKLRVAGAA